MKLLMKYELMKTLNPIQPAHKNTVLSLPKRSLNNGLHAAPIPIDIVRKGLNFITEALDISWLSWYKLEAT